MEVKIEITEADKNRTIEIAEKENVALTEAHNALEYTDSTDSAYYVGITLGAAAFAASLIKTLREQAAEANMGVSADFLIKTFIAMFTNFVDGKETDDGETS